MAHGAKPEKFIFLGMAPYTDNGASYNNFNKILLNLIYFN
jgi:hypothetical protein